MLYYNDTGIMIVIHILTGGHCLGPQDEIKIPRTPFYQRISREMHTIYDYQTVIKRYYGVINESTVFSLEVDISKKKI